MGLQILRSIADEVGAILLADISHPSGLIASGLLNDPLPYCHIVTSTPTKHSEDLEEDYHDGGDSKAMGYKAQIWKTKNYLLC